MICCGVCVVVVGEVHTKIYTRTMTKKKILAVMHLHIPNASLSLSPSLYIQKYSSLIHQKYFRLRRGDSRQKMKIDTYTRRRRSPLISISSSVVSRRLFLQYKKNEDFPTHTISNKNSVSRTRRRSSEI